MTTPKRRKPQNEDASKNEYDLTNKEGPKNEDDTKDKRT